MGEQYDEVVEHIGSFVDEAFVRAAHGFNAGFEGFFAHFLGHAVHAVAEEAGGVAAFRHFALALLDEVLQFGEERECIGLVSFAPAGVRPRVARWAVGPHFYQQCVGIAVGCYGNEVQVVATRFALRPQFSARTAEEGDQSRCLRLLQRLFVHIAQHEDAARLSILHDGRYEAAAFLKIYVHYSLLIVILFKGAKLAKVMVTDEENRQNARRHHAISYHLKKLNTSTICFEKERVYMK